MLGDVVRVYLAGAGPAVLFCLHGGGYCGLTWALVAAALKSECAPSFFTCIWPFMKCTVLNAQVWTGTGLPSALACSVGHGDDLSAPKNMAYSACPSA